MPPVSKLDSRHVLWAGEWLLTVVNGGVYIRTSRWLGPFQSIRAAELAASA